MGRILHSTALLRFAYTTSQKSREHQGKIMKALGKSVIVIFLIAFYCNGIEALVWNDERAEAACFGVSEPPAYIYAVRKECGGPLSCNDICESPALIEQNPGLISAGLKGHCEGALQISGNVNPPGLYMLGAEMYHYEPVSGCAAKVCGPNYCCCRFTT